MKINMVGPVTKRTGYGVHFINLSSALSKQVETSVTARSQVDPSLSNDPEVQRLIQSEFDYDAPTICVWHAECMQLFTGVSRIGFPVFEADLLSEKEVDQLSNLDMILMASQWAKDVVIHSFNKGGRRSSPLIEVVGEGYDPAIFQPRTVQENYMTLGWKRPYIQNVGKWELRKGHPMLIKVLGGLASEGLQFTFVGFWSNLFQPEWRQQADLHLAQAGFIQTSPGKYEQGDAMIVLSERLDTHVDIANVVSMCDFGVYPHKAEGWCLPILETMGCGRPVIATNYSGPSEYLNEEVGLMLDVAGMEPMYDPMFFQNRREGQWAIVDEIQLEIAMRHMITMEDGERKAMGVKALERASEFTWDASADKVIKAVESLGFK